MLKNTQVWLGSHFIMGPPANWNNDPSMGTFMTQLQSTFLTGNCLVIDSNLNHVRISCNTNNDKLTGAVCFKHVLGKCIFLKCLVLFSLGSNFIWLFKLFWFERQWLVKTCVWVIKLLSWFLLWVYSIIYAKRICKLKWCHVH